MRLTPATDRWPWQHGILTKAALLVMLVTVAPPNSLAEASPVAAAANVTDRPDANIETSSEEPALRVAAIGYRLATMNDRACPRHQMLTGLLVHDRAAYDEKAREHFPRLGWGFGILGVVAGSPADASGMHSGDEIVALDGQSLLTFRRDLATRAGTYDRIEAFTALLASTLAVRPGRLLVAREGTEVEVILARKPGCALAFALVPDKTPDAWTDGHYVAVTSGLVDLVANDALAFAMAHELAHIILNHDQERERPLAVLGIGAGHVRREETEADRLAVSLTKTAGYEPAGGLLLFDALGRTGSFRFGFTHPSNRARIATVKNEITRLWEAGADGASAPPHSSTLPHP